MSFLNRVGLLFARRWISGITVSEAAADAIRINRSGEMVMLNYLGEGTRSSHAASRSVKIYLRLLKTMKRSRIKGCISVKPTQLGLCLGYQEFVRNYSAIVSAADKMGIFVWTDMEEHRYTDYTIKAYLDALGMHSNVGICLQARQRGTYGNLKRIVKKGGKIRLVKGAYKDGGGVNYTTEAEVSANYLRCLDYLTLHCKRFIIATHDGKIISYALNKAKRYKRELTFAMLKGIRPKMAAQIAKNGKEIYIYLPFGEEWFQYSMRRLKEFSNIVLVARSIFQG